MHFARSLSEGTPSPVVIKTLHPELAEQPNMLMRFEHEAAIAVSVDSPYVVKIFDVGRAGGELYIAMEHVSGWSLGEVMRAFDREVKVFPLRLALALFRDALLGLEALHTALHPKTQEPLGVVHRDISPRNLMITAEGKLVLIDLGLGRSNIQEWQTRVGVVMGTPGYMSPEQVLAERIDHRSDLYAMSIVLYEMLTLERYISRSDGAAMLAAQVAPVYISITTRREDIPPGLDSLLRKALSIRPEDRYSSAAEMRAALDALGLSLELDRQALLPVVLREKLQAERNEHDRLLANSKEEMPEPEHTVLIAQRGAALREISVITEETEAPADPTETKLISKTPVPKSRSPLMLAAGAAVVAAGIVIGILVAISRMTVEVAPVRDEPIVAVPENKPTPKIEAVVAQPDPQPAQDPDPQSPPEDPQPQPSKPIVTTKPVVTIKPKRDPKPVDPPPVVQPTEATPADLMRDLMREAGEKRKKLPQRAQEIDEIITDASLWKGSEDQGRAAAALKDLRAKLRALN